jgi:glycosyltransferase involved in cell wall biosynthesis
MALVSVIIPCRNEEKNIENCLRSIKNQSFKGIEIVVVDDKSTDRTVEISKKFDSKLVINERHLERSKGRNLGVSESSGEYLLFLDADMILTEDVVSEAVKVMEKDKELLGLYISEMVLGKSFWQKCRRLERSFYDATVVDSVRFVRKEIFNKIGGFDEKLTGPEDWDFDKRIRNEGKVKLLERPNFEGLDKFLNSLNYKKAFADELFTNKNRVIFHNEIGLNLPKYLAKKQYYTYSFKKYIDKWGKNDLDIKRQFGLRYRYLVVFCENRAKIYRILKHPILFLGIFIMRFLVGATYLKTNILCNLYKQDISEKIRL